MALGLQNFREKSLSKINGSLPNISKLMAFMLMMYALLSFYVVYASGNLSSNILVLISIPVMIIASALIFVDFSFNLHRAIGFYAIGIAANRFAKYFQGLYPPTGMSFAFNFVMAILAINMFVTASFFLRGSVRGRFGMLFGSTMMMLGTLLSFVILTTVGDNPMTWGDILVQQPDTIFLILLYMTLIFILNTAPIRTSTDQERQMHILNTIRKTVTCDEDSYIERKDAEILLKSFEDRSEWDKIERGPAECEYWLEIHHVMGDSSYLVVQKWKMCDDCLFFTLTSNRKGAIIDAYRFMADKIVKYTDCEGDDYVSFFSKEGSYSRLRIRDV